MISFPRRRAAAALLAVAAAFGCSRDNPSAPPSLQGIVVTAPDSTIEVGQTVAATATGVDQYGDPMTLKDTKWSSNPSTVATVDSKGLVSALKEGTVVITAKSGGKSGDLQLTISKAPPVLTTITVTVPKTSITLNETITATAAGVDQYGAAFPLGTITWGTTPNDVASVDANGVVKGLKARAVSVTAAAGGKSGAAAMTVTNPAAVVINEIESNGDTRDWIEVFNPTSATVDLTGWVVKDNDDTHALTLAAGSTIPAGGYLVINTDDPAVAGNFGLGAADSARLYNPFGYEVDKWGWSAHAATTLGRCPNGSGPFIVTTSSTKGAANDCSTTIALKINEVESNGDTHDWIELYNPGSTAVDISGYVLKDDKDDDNFTIPTGTTIASHGFAAFDVDAAFGLGAADMARLFSPSGALLDSYAWTAHAGVTYGRCPDGTGDFINTFASTKGAANACLPVGAAWPGSNTVTTVDNAGYFGTNMSGLAYEALSTPVMWAVKNGPGTLYRLIQSGSLWIPDPSGDWVNGKKLLYGFPAGDAKGGDPDAEGVTISSGGSSTGIYVSTERDNTNNGVSRPAILRFDASASGASLTPTNDWNLTGQFDADIKPPLGPNLGIEGITFVPDSYLTTNGFVDDAGHAYNPSDYPNHAGGLFFVALEQGGGIYAYALNHSDNSFKRVATIKTAFSAGVMDLRLDAETNYLFAICDNTCGGLTSTWEIDTNAASATKGKFVMTNLFSRPTGMGNFNNEGFTIAPCVAGSRQVFWSDDDNDDTHALRNSSLPCGRFTQSAASLLRKKK